MKIIQQVEQLQAAIQAQSAINSQLKVGFVPTMGSLHQGHLELVKQAKEKADFVVVSVFVNPTQFNNAKDLETYPRNIDADAELLKMVGCDLLFAPAEKEIYPSDPIKVEIDLNGLDTVMEGAFRPGHFEGVLMVVKRLFDIVQPHLAFFGQKDFQQLSIIQKMVRELSLPIEIVPVPIQRSEKGLALSSRNQLLTEQEKEDALILVETLKVGLIEAKKNSEASVVKKRMMEHFEQGNLELEYLSIVDNESLQEVDVVNERCTICIAAYCGKVRLIDNMQIN